MYDFKEEYLIGIEQVDSEHKRLFQIAEETYQLKTNEFIADKYDEIRALLNELRDYTIMHFEHEEAYMEEIGYKHMFNQKVQHDAFRRKLNEVDIEGINAEFENTEAIIDEILNFLTDWLIHHILETDKQLTQS